MAIASAVLTAFAVQDDGSYQSSEAHAHLFEDWHPQLKGAKLKTADTFVLDTDRREGRAHITCKPRHGATVQPNKQRQRRALNDIKQLNDAGIAALRREHRGGTGLLSKTCIVWRVVRRCTGTTLCDASSTARRGCHCAVTVEYSATVEDVHEQREWVLVHVVPTWLPSRILPAIHLAVALAPSADAARTKALRGSSTTLTTFPSSMSRLIVSMT